MVSDNEKALILGARFHVIVEWLSKTTDDGDKAPTGEDLVDFLAMAIAAIIDQDDNKKTPRDLKLACQSANNRIEKFVTIFRNSQAQTGRPVLHVLIEQAVRAQAEEEGGSTRTH